MKAVDFISANSAGKDYRTYLTHVIRDMGVPVAHIEELIREMQLILNEAKSRLLKKGFHDADVITKIITQQRSRAQAIMDMADNEKIGTIMTGRRGINKLEEFVMGSVSNKIVQMARFNAVWVIT
jgi:nucleotide-binding universal stress UspA family protein